jgi:hypothetical protein
VLDGLGLDEGSDDTFKAPNRADGNILEALLGNLAQKEQEIVSDFLLMTGGDLYGVVQLSSKREVHRFVIPRLPKRFVISVLTAVSRCR